MRIRGQLLIRIIYTLILMALRINVIYNESNFQNNIHSGFLLFYLYFVLELYVLLYIFAHYSLVYIHKMMGLFSVSWM